MKDPTFEEMKSFLSGPSFKIWEASEFDIACAIYWFSTNWHSGQWSNLYSAISLCGYRPGIMEDGPFDIGMELYIALESEYSDKEGEVE